MKRDGCYRAIAHDGHAAVVCIHGGRIVDFDLLGKGDPNPSGRASMRRIGDSYNDARRRVRDRRLNKLWKTLDGEPDNLVALLEMGKLVS